MTEPKQESLEEIADRLATTILGDKSAAWTGKYLELLFSVRNLDENELRLVVEFVSSLAAARTAPGRN